MKMRHTNVLMCEDEAAVAREAADRFVCTAIRSVAERGKFCVAVSGGSSPKGMFELLASRGYVELVPWTSVELFFVDERCVPPESDESNYRMVNDLLLSTVPIPMPNVHRFRGEDTPEEAADQYEQEMHSVLGNPSRFDLIVLGMGADTHTASLFPQTAALREVGRHAVANYVPKLNSYRLTLTFPVINHAENILVIAFGEDKAAALAEALSDSTDVELHPIQGVSPALGRMIWIVDRAAAAKLVVGD